MIMYIYILIDFQNCINDELLLEYQSMGGLLYTTSSSITGSQHYLPHGLFCWYSKLLEVNSAHCYMKELLTESLAYSTKCSTSKSGLPSTF